MSAGRMNICPVNAHTRARTHARCLWADIKDTRAHTQEHSRRKKEVTAKEVGDEWALSKQHSRQEVPIGGFAWRQDACLVCAVARPVREELDVSGSGSLFPAAPVVSVSEAAHVLYRVKVSQGKHLLSFSPTNFTLVLEIKASRRVNKSLKL